MVQIGSAIGSTVGQWTKLTPNNIRTLVTCGAAGGIAATFNAPIAAAIFSMEVLIGRIRTDFLLVLLTSLSSCMIARYFLGNYPAFLAPAYDLVSLGELLLYFLMGTLIGLAAIGYVRLLYWSEDAFAAWKFPDYLKPAVGGLLVGLILRAYPQIYGAGFPAIESALWVRFPWELLLVLFAAELLANCATLGSGGSGGVFAPSLYMGAMLGGAFGSLAHEAFPAWTAGSGAYAMVGMAASFAATAKAPTTSILIVFEMTNDYRIMLPLMAATVASVYVSHRLFPYSIYTLKLHRRGIDYPYGGGGRAVRVQDGSASTAGRACRRLTDRARGWSDPLSLRLCGGNDDLVERRLVRWQLAVSRRKIVRLQDVADDIHVRLWAQACGRSLGHRGANRGEHVPNGQLGPAEIEGRAGEGWRDAVAQQVVQVACRALLLVRCLPACRLRFGKDPVLHR